MLRIRGASLFLCYPFSVCKCWAQWKARKQRRWVRRMSWLFSIKTRFILFIAWLNISQCRIATTRVHENLPRSLLLCTEAIFLWELHRTYATVIVIVFCYFMIRCFIFCHWLLLWLLSLQGNSLFLCILLCLSPLK